MSAKMSTGASEKPLGEPQTPLGAGGSSPKPQSSPQRLASPPSPPTGERRLPEPLIEQVMVRYRFTREEAIRALLDFGA